MTTADLSTTTREIARQAAREVVARQGGIPAPAAARIRAGELDDLRDVWIALAGADAAHAAVLAAVVRACADAVAGRYEIGGLIPKSAAVNAILALLEKDTAE